MIMAKGLSAGRHIFLETTYDAGNRHVQFDEQGWETERRFHVSARAQPRLYQVRTIDLDGPHDFLRGSTIIVDLSGPAIKYRIMKRVDSAARESRTTAFLRAAKNAPLSALLVASDQKEPFALLHSLTGDSGF
jgi:hypothetical protein